MILESCPICASSNRPKLIMDMSESIKSKFLEYSKKKYDGYFDSWLDSHDLSILNCLVCGHFWYREQPDQAVLSEMYSVGRPLKKKENGPSRSATPAMIKEMCRLKKLTGKTNPIFLDYGSGFGRWARAAVDVGFDVTAFEPSEERGEEFVDINFKLVHSKNNLKCNSFDVVNLEQVLEHVPKPVETLKEISVYCKKGAIIRITVPNIIRSKEGSNIWNDWPFNGISPHTMAPFEHLHGFTPSSLQKAVDGVESFNLKHMNEWQLYPLEALRYYLGKFIPQVGQTMVIAQHR